MARPTDQALAVPATPASGRDASRYDRAQTHERLLTREQVDALDDLESLVALQDDVTAAAKAIEVDLEFRSDDGADEHWEHRARTALTAHHVCNGHLTRRIKFLRGGKMRPQPGTIDAKARKKEAQAQLEAAQAENKRAKAAQEREKTVRMITATVSRHSLLLHVHQVACETLDRATISRITQSASARLEKSLLSELPASGIEAAAAGETGTGSTVGESPVAESETPQQLNSASPNNGQAQGYVTEAGVDQGHSK